MLTNSTMQTVDCKANTNCTDIDPKTRPVLKKRRDENKHQTNARLRRITPKQERLPTAFELKSAWTAKRSVEMETLLAFSVISLHTSCTYHRAQILQVILHPPQAASRRAKLTCLMHNILTMAGGRLMPGCCRLTGLLLYPSKRLSRCSRRNSGKSLPFPSHASHPSLSKPTNTLFCSPSPFSSCQPTPISFFFRPTDRPGHTGGPPRSRTLRHILCSFLPFRLLLSFLTPLFIPILLTLHPFLPQGDSIVPSSHGPSVYSLSDCLAV